MAELLTELTAVKAEISKNFEEMKAAVAKRDLEVKDLGAARDETGVAIKTLSDNIDSLNTSYASLEAEISKILTENGRGDQEGGDEEDEKSLGVQFTTSEAYTYALKSGAANTERVSVKSLLRHEQKALTTTGGGAAILTPHRVPGIFGAPVRPFRIRDLITTLSTTDRSVEFVEETGFYQLYARVKTAISIADTSVVVDGPVTGFFVNQVITLSPQTLAEEKVKVTAIAKSTGTLTVTPAFTKAHAANAEISADDFIFTPETEIKPRAKVAFNLQTATMKTLAHWLPASRQMIKNQPMLQNHIDNRLLEGLALSIENQILYGNNDTDQLQGILTNPRTQSYKWSDGITGDTQLDAIRRSLTLAQLAHYPVDGLVMNPIDKERVDTLKGEDGHYLWVNVVEGGGEMLWRVPIVISTAIKQADFLIGAFRMAATLWDGEQANIRIADQHNDYFTRNMVAILAEQDATLTNYRPEAFVHGSFDSKPA